MSNIKGAGTLRLFSVFETMSSDEFVQYMPDIVITFGGHIASCIQAHFRAAFGKTSHWSIEEAGSVMDGFINLTDIFACSPAYFFRQMQVVGNRESKNNRNYYQLFLERLNKIVVPDLVFSNFYVAQKLAEIVPKHALLHLGILNSTRQMQFFDLKSGVEVQSNLGAYGIDGTLSTFLGRSAARDGLCYLLIGDLSFLYDMNALRIRHIKINIRMIIVNNGGGAEFHFSHGAQIPSIRDFISAAHNNAARDWVKGLGYQYLTALNETELQEAMLHMNEYSEVPVILEVFTDFDTDAKVTREVYDRNKSSLSAAGVKGTVKKIAKKILGENNTAKAKDIADILRD